MPELTGLRKPSDLSELFTLLDQEPTQQKNHFLTLMGTDVAFQEKPTPIPGKTYERGESLSYSMQLTGLMLREEATLSDTETLSFTTSSIDVLNGPDTAGFEVGERIAQGVFLALRAVAEGKDSLHLQGFSRGAVEAKLIIEEISRIKKKLNDSENVKTLKEILMDTPCGMTRAAFEKFESINISWPTGAKQKLSDNLNKLKIHAFLVDPVPGSTIYRIVPGWKDERFHNEPDRELCPNMELIYFENETSHGFGVIGIKGVNPTILPGNHGTGCGNMYNQQQNLEEKIEGAEFVQNILLYKLILFINKNSGIVDSARNFQANLEHPHPALDGIMSDFINASDAGRHKIMMECYENILKNKDSLHALSGHNYKFLVPDLINGARIVHASGSNAISLSNYLDFYGSRMFVNSEHAALAHADLMNLFKTIETEDDIITQMEELNKQLEPVIKSMKTNFYEEHTPAELILTNRESYLEAFDSIIHKIGQKYLQRLLPKEEKEKLISELTKTFEIFKDFNELRKFSLQNFTVENLRELQNIVKSQKKVFEEHQLLALFNKIQSISRATDEYFDFNEFNFICHVLKNNNTHEELSAKIIELEVDSEDHIFHGSLVGKYQNSLNSAISQRHKWLLSTAKNLKQQKKLFLKTTFKECFNAYLSSLESSLDDKKPLEDDIKELILTIIKAYKDINLDTNPLSVQQNLPEITKELLSSSTLEQRKKVFAILLTDQFKELQSYFTAYETFGSDAYVNKYNELYESFSSLLDSYDTLNDLLVDSMHLMKRENVIGVKKEDIKVSMDQLIQDCTHDLQLPAFPEVELKKLDEQFYLRVSREDLRIQKENLSVENQKLQEQVSAQQQDLTSIKEQSRKQMQAWQQKVREHRTSEQEKNQRLEEKVKELEELKQEKSQLQKDLQQQQDSYQQLSEEKTHGEQLLQQEKEKFNAMKQELDRLKTQLEESYEDYSKAQQIIEELEGKLELIVNQNPNSRVIIKDQTIPTKPFNERNQKFRGQNREEQPHYKQLRLLQKSLNSLKDENQRLKSEANAKQEILTTQKEKLEKLEKENQDLLATIEEQKLQKTGTQEKPTHQSQRTQTNIEAPGTPATPQEEEEVHATSEQLTRQQETAPVSETTGKIEISDQQINELIRLTNDYLSHLRKQAKRYQNTPVPDGQKFMTRHDNEDHNAVVDKYNAVADKYNKVVGLLDILQSEENNKSKADQFKSEINNVNETTLKHHRDPAWKRYFRTAMAIVGILVTGVAPGLLYTAVKGGHSPIFFNHKTRGEKFKEDSNKVVVNPKKNS